jgi:pilus assembly protein Flp/PilA
MTKLTDSMLKLKIWRDTHGQDLIEYALLGGFLVCACAATVPTVSADVSTVFSKVVGTLAKTSGGGMDGSAQ